MWQSWAEPIKKPPQVLGRFLNAQNTLGLDQGAWAYLMMAVTVLGEWTSKTR